MKPLLLTALLCLCFTPLFSQNSGDIVIVEIMYNPKAVTDANGEWFKLYNATLDTINLKNWFIKDLGSNNHQIKNDLLILPKDFAVFTKKSDISINGGIISDYHFSFTLANTDDEIIILSPEEKIIDEVKYNTKEGYPILDGSSMKLDINYSNESDSHFKNDEAFNWIEETHNQYGKGDFGSPNQHQVETLLFSIDNNSSFSFSIYPTIISKNHFVVDYNKNIEIEYFIYDINGRKVTEDILKTNTKTKINLKAGTYFFRSEDLSEVIIIN